MPRIWLALECLHLDKEMKSEQDLSHTNETTGRERKKCFHLQVLGPQITTVPSHFSRSAHLSCCWESNNKMIHQNIDSIILHSFLKPFQQLLFFWHRLSHIWKFCILYNLLFCSEVNIKTENLIWSNLSLKIP